MEFASPHSNRIIMIKNILALFIATILLFGCSSSSKQLQKGDYDAAMEKAAKKIKKNPGDFEEVDVFNDAYRMAYLKDNTDVKRLKQQGNPANWSKIYAIYSRMNRRQDLAMSLPATGVVYEEQDFFSEMENARKKATEYAYAQGVVHLNKNNRLDARKAYDRFQEANRFTPNYKDVNEKLTESRFKGMTNVFFNIENKANVVIPKQLLIDLKNIHVDDLDKGWINYDNTVDTNRNYHYSVILTMEQILVSPEEVKESFATETKEVEDGFEYQLDDNGNVVKDSLGNDIKVPKYKTISCNIRRVAQRKTARVSGFIYYFDNATDKQMKKEPITSDALFENFYATANGDIAALNPRSQQELNSEPLPFPPTPSLLMQAGDVLKGMTKEIIDRNKNFLK